MLYVTLVPRKGTGAVVKHTFQGGIQLAMVCTGVTSMVLVLEVARQCLKQIRAADAARLQIMLDVVLAGPVPHVAELGVLVARRLGT